MIYSVGDSVCIFMCRCTYSILALLTILNHYSILYRTMIFIYKIFFLKLSRMHGMIHDSFYPYSVLKSSIYLISVYIVIQLLSDHWWARKDLELQKIMHSSIEHCGFINLFTKQSISVSEIYFAKCTFCFCGAPREV